MSYTKKYYIVTLAVAVPYTALLVNSTLNMLFTMILGAVCFVGSAMGGYYLGKRENESTGGI